MSTTTTHGDGTHDRTLRLYAEMAHSDCAQLRCTQRLHALNRTELPYCDCLMRIGLVCVIPEVPAARAHSGLAQVRKQPPI